MCYCAVEDGDLDSGTIAMLESQTFQPKSETPRCSHPSGWLSGSMEPVKAQEGSSPGVLGRGLQTDHWCYQSGLEAIVYPGLWRHVQTKYSTVRRRRQYRVQHPSDKGRVMVTAG
jgi:hypothetical protein